MLKDSETHERFDEKKKKKRNVTIFPSSNQVDIYILAKPVIEYISLVGSHSFVMFQALPFHMGQNKNELLSIIKYLISPYYGKQTINNCILVTITLD